MPPSPTTASDPAMTPDASHSPFKAHELYTIGEICAALKISRRTYHRWLAAGRIPKPLRFQSLGPRTPGGQLSAWFDRERVA